MTVNGRKFITQYTASNRQYAVTTPQGRVTVANTDVLGRPTYLKAGTLEAVNYTTYDGRGRIASVSQGTGAQQRALSAVCRGRFCPQTRFLGYICRQPSPMTS